MERFFLLLVLAGLLGGCGTIERSHLKDHPFVIDNTYRMAGQRSSAAQPGTIWKGEAASVGLYGDQRARNLGDILSVKIVEVSTADEKVSTDAGKTSDVNGGITGFFGQENKAFANPAGIVTANTKNNFSGTGETKRDSTLSATISVRVVDVLPNGHLAVEGKREIYINNEKKEILLQGIVRPKDIAFDNSIFSSQVADAKMIYTGIGVLGEKQRPGWASRIMDYVWPF